MSRAPDDDESRLRRASPGPRDLIRIDHLRKVFGAGTPNELVALDDISCSIREGDFVSIVGPSGCGKSTVGDSQFAAKIGDPHKLFTNDLSEEVNAFDKAAIIQQAKNFKL